MDYEFDCTREWGRPAVAIKYLESKYMIVYKDSSIEEGSRDTISTLYLCDKDFKEPPRVITTNISKEEYLYNIVKVGDELYAIVSTGPTDSGRHMRIIKLNLETLTSEDVEVSRDFYVWATNCAVGNEDSITLLGSWDMANIEGVCINVKTGEVGEYFYIRQSELIKK